MNDPQLPIFFDPTRHRYVLIKWVVILALATAIAWVAIFALSLYYVEKLPAPSPPAAGAPAQVDGPDAPQDCAFATGPDGVQVRPRLRVFAHLPVVPDWAGASFGRDCGTIGVLMADRFAVALPSAEIVSLTPEPEQAEALRKAQGRGDVTVLPVLTLSPAAGDAGAPAALSGIAAASGLADRIADRVGREGHAGLCLRVMPGLDADPGLAAFLSDLAGRLARDGRGFCLVVAAESPLWRDPAVVAQADPVVLLAYRAPASGTGPEHLAPQAWFRSLIAEALANIGRDRLVVGIGAFGVDWVDGQPGPIPVAYAEAMRLAARGAGQIDPSPDGFGLAVRTPDAEGRHHDIRLLDAVSAYNQRRLLEDAGVGAVAVWSLGLEDPGVWAALSGPPADIPDLLAGVSLDDYVGYEGQGPLYRVLEEAQAGTRRLDPDPATGLVVAQHYDRIPRPYTLQRLGRMPDDAVILSFDDGPSADFTPRILDVLRDRQVPAVFFVIGSNVLKTPDLLGRMIGEGHEIGSHTFFHPDITVVSDLRRHLELSALQRLIVSVTGRSTLLFRSPYGRGAGPLTAEQAQPFHAIGQQGYAILGSTVVPPDWLSQDPGDLVRAAMAQMQPQGGNVIVLHDGGGDRTATVAALPVLIDALRGAGYRFATVAELMRVDRATLMPADEGLRATLDAWSFRLIESLGAFFRNVFWIAIVLGALRSVAILVLALLRRHYPVGDAPFAPPVTVVIPAYDESEVILDSIAAALGSDYPDLKVIVVDDGSTDDTAERVLGRYGDDPRVLLIRERNEGKWKALDIAYTQVDTEVVVAVDADTALRPDAIRKLVRAFADPAVGAVAGKVEIGNRHGLLARLQALEYLTAQNVDRRAAEVFNGMLVVPGAIGAWRTEAVRKAGLYVNQTVTEDADLTLAVLRAGYRVVFENEAVSVTEAPETLANFMRQRLRWTFGMMQTAWKHRRAAREGRAVGWISIPDLWLFGVGLGLLAPIADLVFLGSLLDVMADLASGRPLTLASAPLLPVVSYLALPLLDALLMLAAFAFERKAPWPVLLLPLQRLVYRPLLYVTVYRALWRALIGRLAGWGKFRHLGGVIEPGR